MTRILVRSAQGRNEGWLEIPEINPKGGTFWMHYSDEKDGHLYPTRKAIRYRPHPPFGCATHLSNKDLELIKELNRLIPLNPPGTNDPTLDEVNPFG